MDKLWAPFSAAVATFVMAGLVANIPPPPHAIETSVTGAQAKVADASAPSIFTLWIKSTAVVAKRDGSADPQAEASTSMCTAWAVDADHLATASHCIDALATKTLLAKDSFGAAGDFMPDDGPQAPQNLVDVSDLHMDLSLSKPDRPADDLIGASVQLVKAKAFNETDSALLRVTGLAHPLKPLPIARTAPKRFDPVVAFGYPGDMSIDDFGAPLLPVAGIVAGPTTITEGYMIRNVTIVTMTVIEGMSGGPVENLQGEVVGVINGYSNSNKGVSFITRHSDLKEFLDEAKIRAATIPVVTVPIPSYRLVAFTVMAVSAGVMLVVIVLAFRRRRLRARHVIFP